jgi:hypothetical protein
MTTKEIFEDFLVKIGGVKFVTRRDTLIEVKDSAPFQVGEGWYPILKSLIEELIQAGWNKEIFQCKEKFGGLRFYINENVIGGNMDLNNIISKYESLSYNFCETCGEEGKIRNDLNWIETLCDTHYQERKNKKGSN